MNTVVFIDFDGTITKVDTCEAMVKAFANDGWSEVNKLWEEKKLSTEECANETFKLFNADLNDIKNLMDTVEIDECFIEFLNISREKGYKIYILSDGYDFNIRTILERYDIDVPFFSNKLIYKDGFRIECPNINKECGMCGTCKTSLIYKLKGQGNRVIYIGDGYSDTCAVMNADLVFAKGKLFEYCTEKGLDAVYFNGFKEIITNVLL